MLQHRFLPGLALGLALAMPGWSQDARGTIVGRVMDSTGAVIAGAKVDVTNQAMGTRFSFTTTEVGFYQAALLIPGLYRIEADAPGFKKFQRDNIEVRVNDRIEVDITLEVGTAEQSITVTEETPLLNTASASLGSVVDSRRVAELPIAHGNPYQLIGLAAGVTFTRDQRLDRPFEPTHIVGYGMDGTRANRGDVTLDGAPSTATANAGEVIASYVPPADIVAEFKVQTTTFDASFGQTEGGVTNISTKAGTNQFHGSAYYNKMAPELFANDFFANATGQPRGDFSYDRWGGHVGGPVVIPKLYNGKNKTFFLYGYEGISESRPRNNGTPTVATAAQRDGDFSNLLKVSANYQIYNPFTRRSVGGGRFEQDPFPNNIIPKSMLNPVSLKIQDYFSLPLTAGDAEGRNNFQQPNLLEVIDYATHSVRVDHVVSQKQRAFLRLSWYDRDSNYNNYFHNLSTGNWFQFASRSAVFDDVYTLTPTTILNFRYGYNRFVRATFPNPEARGFDLTTLGFPKAYNDAIPEAVRQFPRIDIAGYQGTAIGGEWRPNDTHSVNASVQSARGSHFLKGGMEFRAYRETRELFGNDQVGRFVFESTYTRGPRDNSPQSPNSGFGQTYAAFLLGLPSGSNSLVVRQPDYAEQSLSWGFFVHDDWKVNHRLSLNLGLRWEFENALTERFDRSVRGFDYGYTQPFDAAARAAYALNPTPEVPASQFRSMGGLTFANVGGQPRGLYNTPKNQIMPRIGLSYRLNDKTVLRSGYGIFYGFLGQRRGDVIQSGFSRNTPFVGSLDNGLTFVSTLSNPFPDGILEPVGAADGPLTFVGQGVTFFNENPKNSYMQRWQLSIQRELKGGFLAEAVYVGNRGTHIELNPGNPSLVNFNPTPQAYLSRSPLRDNQTIAYLTQNLPNPYRGLLPAGAISALTSTNIARERLLRQYPHFDAVNTTRADGYSWYHALQLNLEKRFARGYTVQANYTFSKFMQATELLNPDDAAPHEVISDADRPHRLTLSGIWELPFGKGKAFLDNVHPVVNGILGGWQVSGIYTYQMGAPLGNWGNVIYVGDINAIRRSGDEQTLSAWFNTNTGFERSSALQLDRNVRTFPYRFGFLRGDSINNVDLGLFKHFNIRESMRMQFRADFLNAFNTPLFPNPNLTPTAAQFGQIVASTQANYARRIQMTAKFIF